MTLNRASVKASLIIFFQFQRRFYLTGQEEKSSWWIPISFTSSQSSDFHNTTPKFWMKGENEIEETVNFGEWYLLNNNYSGE